MIVVRVTIGFIARGVFWAMVWLIVGNAVARAISDGSVFGAIFAVVLFPLTVSVYPFIAPDGAVAWPLAAGSSLIPLLVVGAIAYPISTFIGGLRSV